MSPFIKKHISRKNHNKPDLLEYANEQRKQGLFNDVTIEVENQFIPANRMILSCYSDYFKNMFTTPMKERYEQYVKLTNVDNKSTKLLINYIYTGNIDIDDENVINLLSAADYLQLDQVKQFCFEFLESILTTESCFEILAVADLYRDDSLKNKVHQFISSNLLQIIKSETFKNLSKFDLFTCISNLDKKHTNETFVYYAITTWVKHDKEKRESDFPELFQLVQLNKVPVKYLATVISNEKLVQENLICSNLALKEFAQRTSAKFDNESSPKILGLICSSDLTLKLCEFNQNFEQTNSIFPNLPVKYLDGQIFKVNNFVFCAADSIIWRMNLNEQNKNWIKVRNYDACYNLILYKTVILDFYFEMNASYMNLPLNENENFQQSQWQALPSLNQSRKYHAATICEDSLYVLGGYVAGDSIKSVERLPGLIKTWETVASMQRARDEFAAVSYKHFVFALGGYDSSSGISINSVEMFDSIENTWIYVKPMINERRAHTACVVGDKIFVAGGKNDNGDVKEIEYYDISRDIWNVVRCLDSKLGKILSILSR